MNEGVPFLFPCSRFYPLQSLEFFFLLPRLIHLGGVSAAIQDSTSHALALSPFLFGMMFHFDLNYFFKVLNQWIMDQVPIGNKAPRPGHARQFWCPACRGLLENPLALTSGHVLLECMAVEGTCKEVFLLLLPLLYNLLRYTNP